MMLYFISDIHFGLYDRKVELQREEFFFTFLKGIDNSCSKLFIVGDLFDYWFDYHKVIPKNFYRIVAKLYEFKSKGNEIIYLMGNHDFGHYNFFQQELGIEVIENDLEIESHKKKFFISHGDDKVPNDYGYLFLRKILRNPFAKKFFRLLHPDFGIAIANNSSKKSRKYTLTKFNSENDLLIEFAKKKIEEGFDFVILGHTHKAGITNFNKGIYVNLGSWLDSPKFALFDGNDLKLLEVKNFISFNNKFK